MAGDGVVDRRRDPRIREPAADLGTIRDACDSKVMDGALPLGTDEFDASARQTGGVPVHHRPTRAVPAIEMHQFDRQRRCLNGVEATVVPKYRMGARM